MHRILVFLTLVFVLSCNSSENKNETTSEVKETQTNPPQTQQEIYLPSISLEEMESLWNNCNQADFTYYQLPISTSLSDKYSIQQSFKHVSDTPVPLDMKNRCFAIARVFYKKDGDDLMDAEIYFSQGCSFFVFFKDGKPAYSNLMTNAGVKHFDQIIQKAISIQPNQ